MKNRILLYLLLTTATFTSVQAQTDSTLRIFDSGFGIYAELGMLPANKAIRNELAKMNIKPFTAFMGSVVLTRRRESPRWFSEGRIIAMNSTNYTTGKNGLKADLAGIGIGTDGGPKLMNNPRWNLTIPFGADVMLYRLSIKSDGQVAIGPLLQNPSAYKPVRLLNANINLHAGIGADYKMDFLPKFNEKVFLSGKLTYQQPLLAKRKWKSESVTVSDLPSLKLNQIFFQIGLVFFPKRRIKS
ncbi:hypothetical protein [Dyadobacter sediminis]|uniref:Outer membrane protein beta-barrel domain-containing protein n=1 Tax=Dyadobacter sediminis TaxID=1493691 RepID=A0A5R9KIA6_9BACT|nr:hypothetical protein [Dyadobacter sediminis]TLU95957.1 hypothetical protein FEM55_02060 [Dyadobacter sediminis]GGB78066.1 hypothetical protein GCM10011325_01940 [Dyadobacter sediminis]